MDVDDQEIVARQGLGVPSTAKKGDHMNGTRHYNRPSSVHLTPSTRAAPYHCRSRRGKQPPSRLRGACGVSPTENQLTLEMGESTKISEEEKATGKNSRICRQYE
ncbi:hypothetical protein SCLCIDRAFT_11796 [Scleroderma citrinum Foug A]|uniref:Uncharacterized protein n=1 Tax=Scleroderma citrinum Foug A TaxID=1036808 RepID=A0A0C3CVU0_9AGAM|nr:hypothetical protein SCLCIDRAFT_11796 [Scleroderma citrinum Foug A]